MRANSGCLQASLRRAPLGPSALAPRPARTPQPQLRGPLRRTRLGHRAPAAAQGPSGPHAAP
eukprot:7048391-Lingulodinium_polyedra.AAC.1